ncbi:class I SAM-dependent methyltransferase [Euzebya tangerina]|uniref:class I SAM-dependent methyltransferase n=1 Tax=Euzebya tangerina TaxID=591198 RepID=UPI001F0BB6BF|nr:class I SAM-dependent methyltransferase [Euzebya tangerina]
MTTTRPDLTGPDPTLPDPRPSLEKDAALVQDMFDRVAPKYDIANALLSFGQDQHWRRVAVRALAAQPGERILDVATGTGRLAREIQSAGAHPVALDFSWNMLAAGAASEAKEGLPRLEWLNGDGTALPFADDSFDGATIGFGLRNLPDPRAGLAEFARVVRPGGRMIVLEFSTPTNAALKGLYLDYLVGALPRIAEVVSSDPSAYRYLAESIIAWPDQRALAGWLVEAGWTSPRWQNLSGGIVALHHAVAP